MGEGAKGIPFLGSLDTTALLSTDHGVLALAKSPLELAHHPSATKDLSQASHPV